MKRCYQCKKELDDSEFYKGYYKCKKCHAKHMKSWQKRNPEKKSIIERRSRLKKYNITIDEYNNLLKKQNYSCAICGRKTSGRKDNDNFAIDHDHNTQKVRGLLCMQCNTAIGKLKENIEYFNKAILYLQKDI
jgi:DNA-directed RNA polymerase subunit RPC12/RpoP